MMVIGYDDKDDDDYYNGYEDDDDNDGDDDDDDDDDWNLGKIRFLFMIGEGMNHEMEFSLLPYVC